MSTERFSAWYFAQPELIQELVVYGPPFLVSVLVCLALGGRVEVDIVAVEEEAGVGDVAVLRDAKGLDYRIPLAEVKDARLAIKWKCHCGAPAA